MRFDFGDCRLDADRRELRREGEAVHVEPQVFDLLLYLIRNRDRVVTKDDLIAAVWEGRIVSESTLGNRINAARAAIGDSGERQQFIRTVARRGFMFVGAVGEGGADGSRLSSADPANTSRPAGEDPAPALPDKPSIAVLPFANLSDDPQQEYFADGMAEEIITALSRCRWLFVIARNSSFSYKGQNVDVRRIGRELGVRYVLEGSVRRAGNIVRFGAQLVEAASGAHIWADRFEGELSDVFELQDRITGNVVAVIEPKLQLAEIERLKRKPAARLDAYDLYLRALQLENEFTEASLTEALECLQRAVALDPGYAPAMALAAHCYVVRSFQGWVKDFDAEKTEAMRLANRAIDLDPDNGDVLSMAAFAVHIFTGDSPRAREIASRSLSINPSSTIALTALAWSSVLAEPDNSIRLIERVQRLSPRDPRAWWGFMIGALGHMWLGRYTEAIAWAERALRLRRAATPLRVLVISYVQLGQREKAAQALRETLEIDPTLTLSNLHLRLRAVSMQEDKWKLTYESMREAGLPE